MIKTQVQIPDDLYRKAKQVAREREMSFAEVTRRGLEYITTVYHEVEGGEWALPLFDTNSEGGVSQKQIADALQHDRDERG